MQFLDIWWIDDYEIISACVFFYFTCNFRIYRCSIYSLSLQRNYKVQQELKHSENNFIPNPVWLKMF